MTLRAITRPDPLRLVAVSGSTHAPSKTTALVERIAAAFGERIAVEVHLVRVDLLGPHLAGALRRNELPEHVEQELRRIEQADLLVVASPVYRASFTGLFKHLFDFVDQYALVDTPVFLAASGGSERHALIIEHQFRPLFGFFQALTLPLGVYANDADFRDGRVHADALHARIEKAIDRALPVLRASLVERGRPEWRVQVGDAPVAAGARVG